MAVDLIVRGRGELIEAIDEIIKEDLDLNGLFINTVYNRIGYCHLIYLIDHTLQRKCFIYLVCSSVIT